jgi:hypothetical protein
MTTFYLIAVALSGYNGINAAAANLDLAQTPSWFPIRSPWFPILYCRQLDSH